MTPEQLRAIERADMQRRADRETETLLMLHSKYSPSMSGEGIDPYHYSRAILGVPSDRNRVKRAHVSSWNRGMRGRTFGIAATRDNGLLTDADAIVRGSVNVTHADGTSEVRQYRARSTRRTRQTITEAPHVITAADLAPIADYSNDN